MYVGLKSLSTVCKAHLPQLKDTWLLRITKLYVILTPEEISAVAEDYAKALDSGVMVDAKPIYTSKYCYHYLYNVLNKMTAYDVHSPPSSMSSEEISNATQLMKAPEQMSAEVEIIKEGQAIVNEIPASNRRYESNGKIECMDCGKTSNLWLNLSDGYIGCGRYQYGLDDSGCTGKREGAAIRHWEEDVSCDLALKLGSLTDSNCEVFSYCRDMFVTLPRELVNEALARCQLKGFTGREKTIEEMAIESNKNLAIEGETSNLAERLNAHGVGIVNIGNSCYISAIIHFLRIVYASKKTESEVRAHHIPSAVESLCRSLNKQKPDARFDSVYSRVFAKLTDTKGKNVSELNAFTSHDTQYHYGCPSPIILKRLVGAKYPDFNTHEQQDADEYLQLLCSEFDKVHDSTFSEQIEVVGIEKIPTSPSTVRLIEFKSPVIDLTIPEGLREAPEIPLEVLFAEYRKSRRGLTHFPPFIIAVIRRQFMTDSSLGCYKSNSRIVLPDLDKVLNFSAGTYNIKHPGLLKDETEHQDVCPRIVVDQLVIMGFTPSQCEAAWNALQATTSTQDPDSILSSMIQYLLEKPSFSTFDNFSENLATLMSLGFDQEESGRAIVAFKGDVDLAINYLCRGENSRTEFRVKNESGAYRLRATIVHKGQNVNTGHYYAVCRQDNRYDDTTMSMLLYRWWKYNDENVSEVTKAAEILEQAYMLLFERAN